jgi:hypothetical protein
MSKEEKVSVKVLLSTINYAIEQIANFDDEFKAKLKSLDEVIQWRVEDDISFYTEIKNGAIKGFEGVSDNPTLTFEFSDAKSALNFLTGRMEITELGDKIKLSGEAAKAVQLSFIMDTLKNYIGGLAR